MYSARVQLGPGTGECPIHSSLWEHFYKGHLGEGDTDSYSELVIQQIYDNLTSNLKNQVVNLWMKRNIPIAVWFIT